MLLMKHLFWMIKRDPNMSLNVKSVKTVSFLVHGQYLLSISLVISSIIIIIILSSRSPMWRLRTWKCWKCSWISWRIGRQTRTSRRLSFKSTTPTPYPGLGRWSPGQTSGARSNWTIPCCWDRIPSDISNPSWLRASIGRGCLWLRLRADRRLHSRWRKSSDLKFAKVWWWIISSLSLSLSL